MLRIGRSLRYSSQRYGAVQAGIEDELSDILSVSRAAAITGPPQAGKSTLAKQLQAAGIVPNYFSLDDQATRTAGLSDPDGFALSLPRPSLIDEVPRTPDLMLAIKQILDDDLTPGQFLLTGSADLVTTRVIADALPGRVEYVNLWPLSQAEIVRNRTSVVDALLAGAPPQVVGATKGRAASAELVVSGGFPGVCRSHPARGRPPSRPRPDREPEAIKALIARLGQQATRTVRFRDGPDDTPMTSQFTFVRVRAAHDVAGRHGAPRGVADRRMARRRRGAAGLLISNMAPDTPPECLARLARLRWKIELDYRQLKVVMAWRPPRADEIRHALGVACHRRGLSWCL